MKQKEIMDYLVFFLTVVVIELLGDMFVCQSYRDAGTSTVLL